MGQTTQDGTLYSYDKTAAGLKDLENHVTEQFDISAASNNRHLLFQTGAQKVEAVTVMIQYMLPQYITDMMTITHLESE